MGCDIHAYIQYKDRNYPKQNDCFAFQVWSVNLWRDYALFTVLANVRAVVGLEAIADPRGLPPIVSWKLSEEINDPNWHSHSWLDFFEVQEALSRYRQRVPNWPNSDDAIQDMEVILATMRKLYEQEREPILLFWFDN